MTTPIVPLIVNGYLMKPLKVVLLSRVGDASIALHSVDLNNDVKRYSFDANGEVQFGNDCVVGVWLTFDQFSTPEVPDFRVIFAGNKVEI